tara:strand:+ start:8732 stop:10405 length:1674 start_codon:yes stop_codon:yes gene_type:complete
MENFVSVILKNKEIDENAIVEAMLNALDAPLAERIQEYGLFESENNSIVVRLVTPYELDNEESDTFAESFSNKMFEMGFDDFEIETSLTEAILKRGAKGPKVKKLQYDLGVQPADGDFGPATEKAVKKFQTLYQLKPDGMVGPNTQKMIAKTVSISLKDKPEYHKSVPRSNFGALSAFRVSRRGGLMNNPKQVDSIKELQKELKRRNNYKGPIDGKYGPDTKDAVATFQKMQGLYVDGDAGPKTIQALMQRDDKITTTDLPPADTPDKGGLAPPKDDKKEFPKMDTAPKEKTTGAYIEVRGSGQGKRYKVYDENGKVIKSGRGSGPRNLPTKDEYLKDKEANFQGMAQTDSNVVLGLTMYKDSEEAAEALKGKSTEENGKLVVTLLKRFAKKRDDLSKKDKIKVLKTIIAVLDYDMKIPGFGEKNYKRLKKYLASLEGKDTKETTENKVGMFEETYDGDEFYEMYGWIGAPDEELDLWEAEYRGRKVKLNKPMQGDVKKFKVYVKNPKGNIIKVNFGDPNMRIKKSNPKRRKSFRARHNCDNPGPKTKARYWSCRKW